MNFHSAGRLAPSPSGRMHLGNIYAFLIAWAFARKSDAKLRLRIDDLDERCQNKDFQQQLIFDLDWLGLDWDGEIVWQSNRLELYEDAWNDLKKTGNIYPCFCSRADLHASSAPHASDGTPIYAGTCLNLSAEEIKHKMKHKNPAWRIKVPNENIAFEDVIFGNQVQNLQTESGDFILRRSDGIFAYQFCNCVDDIEMGITQIVRGCDLLPSVCRELFLSELMCVSHVAPLSFCHIPMFVNTSNQRLAKRDKSKDLGAMIAEGCGPNDIIGKVAHLIGLTENPSPICAKEFLELFNTDALKGETKIIVV